jgi:hypothetical protein
MILNYDFLNFFLPHPARPISPVPKRRIVAGSGAGALTLTGIIGKHPSSGITIIKIISDHSIGNS